MIKVLENRRIEHLQIHSHYLDKGEAKAVLNFLNSPNATYSELTLKFADADDVTEVLRAIKNRYSFKYANIETEEPISQEAEELAM